MSLAKRARLFRNAKILRWILGPWYSSSYFNRYPLLLYILIVIPCTRTDRSSWQTSRMRVVLPETHTRVDLLRVLAAGLRLRNAPKFSKNRREIIFLLGNRRSSPRVAAEQDYVIRGCVIAAQRALYLSSVPSSRAKLGAITSRRLDCRRLSPRRVVPSSSLEREAQAGEREWIAIGIHR